MKTRQAIERQQQAVEMDMPTQRRRAGGSAPARGGGPGRRGRPGRRPVEWLLAGALLVVPLIVLTWDGRRVNAQFPAPPLTVNRPDDAGDGVCDFTCTLRDAVLAANATPAADVINFDPSLTTVTLVDEIIIQGGTGGGLTINGNGAKVFTIDGGPNTNRLFFLNTGNVTITDVTLTGGEGGGTFFGPVIANTGGAIAGYLSTLLLDRVHVTNNWAIAGVGGVNLQHGHLRIKNSTFSANVAPSCGGVNVGGPDATLQAVNSTFSGNTTLSDTGVGGGVCAASSTIFRNVTIVGNHAGYGGGIFQTAGTVGLVNTIVAGNTDDNGFPEIFLQSGIVTSAGFNLIGDSPGDAASTLLPITYHLKDILDTPPMLFALDDYGGPTPTHAIQSGSPLIDAGSHNFAFDFDGSPLLTDQRGNGFPRLLDNEVDIGALEAQGSAPPPPPNTPPGTGITVQSPAGDASVTITQVLAAGETTFTPINPLAYAGMTPPGYTILGTGLAYDITTTALYTPPVDVCFVVSSVNDPVQFASLRILHGEGGQLVDRTILAPGTPAPDFATRRLCARVGSLSPFVVAQWLTPNGDTTAPAVTISAPPDGATFVKGQAVAAGYSCADEAGGSGLASCTGTVAHGALIDTSTVGTHTFTVTGADLAGNSATATSTYHVVYGFSGFLQPVENLPVLNIANAGSAIPVRFSLGGNQGLAIFAAGYPASSPIPCDASEPGTVIEETVAAGSSSLSYNAAADQYNYVWKTDRSWGGTCRMLVVRFNDGAEHLAKFRFK